jgi:hypothetical protein
METNHDSNASMVGPWPAGWPLPLSASFPGLRWEEAIEAYLDYCRSEWATEKSPNAEPSVTTSAPR